MKVDAHNADYDGTQPPVVLFSFGSIECTRPHTLNVVNLEDPRFGDASQITFVSVIVTVLEGVVPTTSGGLPTSTPVLRRRFRVVVPRLRPVREPWPRVHRVVQSVSRRLLDLRLSPRDLPPAALPARHSL
ncbi:hypothetical protein B0H21DRAFT_384895 [Amylocystis lapponica]|nr:hypothetical protein B0H21DRAFT_384895 [Amylocystis lapponica]